MKTTPVWPFLLPVAMIAFTEGLMNPFWIWNATPIALGYALLRRARRRAFRPAPEIGFIVLSCGLSLLVHAAWMFDWGRSATGSSTSALIFIFLPVYAIVLGGIAFVALRMLTRREVS